MNTILSSKKQQGIKAFSFILFLQFCLSMELWVGWGGMRNIWMALLGVLSLFVIIQTRIPLVFSNRNILICISYFIVYLVVGQLLEFKIVLTQVPTTLIPIISIVCIKDDYKPIVLRYIIKYYATLITVSILIYLICIFIHIPSLGKLNYGQGSYEDYDNYIFYIREGGVSNRFGGPFLEPGYVGMMGAFLLMSDLFDFKNKNNRIILLSVLLSFSLAGYALVFIGYMFKLVWQKKISLTRIIIIMLLFEAISLFAQTYNGGENILNELIYSRLQLEGGEKGFSGNNRTSIAIMVMFFDMWSDPYTLLYGYPASSFSGLSDWEFSGTGFYFFTVTHGLLHVIYIALIYILMLLYSKDKRFASLFLIFVCFSFWQRNYALWLSWIICYHYAIVSVDQSKK